MEQPRRTARVVSSKQLHVRDNGAENRYSYQRRDGRDDIITRPGEGRAGFSSTGERRRRVDRLISIIFFFFSPGLRRLPRRR